MVAQHRETGQHQVQDADVQPHATQEHAVVRRQGRGVEEGLEHGEGEGRQRAGDGGCQNVTWEERHICFTPFSKHCTHQALRRL